MSQAVRDRLDAVATQVTDALDALLPPVQGPESRLLEAMRYAALSGGKRLRPFLTIETGRMFDADPERLVRTACAVECVHAYSLIHDDLPCMDDDDLRRGLPTVHKKFDEATAVLAGDALLTLAFELLADARTHPDPQMRCLLISGLARASGPAGMVAGQMIDMAGAAVGADFATISRMNRLKTGALIAFAVDAGARHGAATEERRHALARFAQDFGMAFQLSDDLLDATAGEAETGKATGKDADAGKVNTVTTLGVEAAQERLRLLVAQAKTHLAGFGSRAHMLSATADYVLDRRR